MQACLPRSVKFCICTGFSARYGCCVAEWDCFWLEVWCSGACSVSAPPPTTCSSCGGSAAVQRNEGFSELIRILLWRPRPQDAHQLCFPNRSQGPRASGEAGVEPRGLGSPQQRSLAGPRRWRSATESDQLVPAATQAGGRPHDSSASGPGRCACRHISPRLRLLAMLRRPWCCRHDTSFTEAPGAASLRCTALRCACTAMRHHKLLHPVMPGTLICFVTKRPTSSIRQQTNAKPD